VKATVVVKSQLIARGSIRRVVLIMLGQQLLLLLLLVSSVEHCASFMISTKSSWFARVLRQPQYRQAVAKIPTSGCFEARSSRPQKMSESSLSAIFSDAVMDDEIGNSIETTKLINNNYSTYIGLSCTFDACINAGQHIPIDERYIPSSLLEWGYVPTTLETIVFETVPAKRMDQTSGNDRTINQVARALSQSSILPTTTSSPATGTDVTRSIYTVLPATGCDNDNLETILTTEHYTGRCTFTTSTTSTTIYDKNVSNSIKLGIETSFRWIPEEFLARSVVENANGIDERYRIRINFEIEQKLKVSPEVNKPNDDTNVNAQSKRMWKIINPIRISIERNLVGLSQIHPDSMKSGGLDSRTITQLLGPTLHSENVRSFPKHQSQHLQEIKTALLEYHSHGAEMITLPGNVTISTSQLLRSNDNGDDVYQIDIGYLSSNHEKEHASANNSTITTKSRKYVVVSHQIPFEYNKNDDLSTTHVTTTIFDL
jgi:hypothetical protein